MGIDRDTNLDRVHANNDEYIINNYPTSPLISHKHLIVLTLLLPISPFYSTPFSPTPPRLPPLRHRQGDRECGRIEVQISRQRGKVDTELLILLPKHSRRDHIREALSDRGNRLANIVAKNFGFEGQMDAELRRIPVLIFGGYYDILGSCIRWCSPG
jgi:hypothetical protein